MASSSTIQVDEINENEIRRIKQIGEGTTSRVYLGKYKGKDIAIKELKEPDEVLDRKSRKYLQSDFENELVINMLLNHDHIIKLLGYIIKNKKVSSLIFEYCDYSQVLNCKTYNLTESLTIAIQIAGALYYSHSIGIIHRDLKPSQVLILKNPYFQNSIISKLGDWGLSISTSSGQKQKHSTAGTLEFMAPEMLTNGQYDSSADVYSFGILLYCLVSRENYPYHDHYLTPEQSAVGVIKKNLRPNLGSNIPQPVQQIIKMCWHSNPPLRPTMDVVLTMLKSTLQRIENQKEEGRRSSSISSLPGWIWGTKSTKVDQSSKSDVNHKNNDGENVTANGTN